MLRYVLNSKSKVQVSIYNATGQPVLQQQLPAAFAKLTVQQQQLYLPYLPPGMYLLRLSSGTEIKTARFIVTPLAPVHVLTNRRSRGNYALQ